ncbi:MAG: tetratricopeptide repeat protein [Gammaproteobacteria bacterium]
MKINKLAIMFMGICLFQGGYAEPDPAFLFKQAQAYYQASDYEEALSSIKQAVKLSPDNSDYQHFLGKCYGRVAENANWLKAMSLTRKTREAFEKAVELDHHNVSALRDLMSFYRRAPGFLGGDRNKADKIERLLSMIDVPG